VVGAVAAMTTGVVMADATDIGFSATNQSNFKQENQAKGCENPSS
jgi:hypothetical protein